MQQEAPTKRALLAALSRARDATLRLVEPVDDEQLVTQVSPIMSPLVWDLAHIGWFEELWLIRRVLAFRGRRIQLQKRNLTVTRHLHVRDLEEGRVFD